MRHALGILGIVAAGVLLAVSAAMNYRFGFSLGRTELDGQIYGAASAAADCLKALVPFFFFAAIRNRMWSQATASAVVWTIVTAYSFTSCLGHAALNRFAGASERQVEAQSYQDLRADLKRAQDQLGWIPQYRPAQTIQSDIDNAKNQRAWGFTNGCADVTGRQGREFCQQYHHLNAELAASAQGAVLEKRIAEVQDKLGKAQGGTVMAEADPQAAVLARIMSLDQDKVQMAMTIFIALLLEIGSGFGMYIAFSQWRIYDSYALAAPRKTARRSASSVAAPAEPPLALAAPESSSRAVDQMTVAAGLAMAETVPATPAVEPTTKALSEPANSANSAAVKFASQAPSPVVASANDNKVEPIGKTVAPENEAELYYRERVVNVRGKVVSTAALYGDYRRWTKGRNGTPLAQKEFERKFEQKLLNCGLKKEQNGRQTRYIDIALKSDVESTEVKKPPGAVVRAA